MKTLDNYDVKIFTDNIEDNAVEQIKALMSIDVFSKCKIRIMPDVHAGTGCVIGFTGDIGERVIPNIVGVDIGCGILVQPFNTLRPIDFHALNEFILKNIPSGRKLRSDGYVQLPDDKMDIYRQGKEILKNLRCFRDMKEIPRLKASMGSLGGGNHFIEIDKDENGYSYLVIHTGSRNIGKQVADIYQKLSLKCLSGWDEIMEKRNRIINEYKQAGRRAEIPAAISELHRTFVMRKPSIPAELAYLEKSFRDDYLYDMKLCQHWAIMNRRLIADLIMRWLVKEGYVNATEDEWLEHAFESVHNYIGEDNIIRKGAISAIAGQKCIIPLNMRDGSLICTGKGNEDWNNSAPHGAGRIMSRGDAFKKINMEDYIESMKGIYSECLCKETMDESPMVYKPKEEIMGNIGDTVKIDNIIKPVFNFKASV